VHSNSSVSGLDTHLCGPRFIFVMYILASPLIGVRQILGCMKICGQIVLLNLSNCNNDECSEARACAGDATALRWEEGEEGALL
jgi:hypothetical protein